MLNYSFYEGFVAGEYVPVAATLTMSIYRYASIRTFKILKKKASK